MRVGVCARDTAGVRVGTMVGVCGRVTDGIRVGAKLGITVWV